jgi:DNA polymerase
LLALFRDKKDPYCALASEIYGRTITKADKLERHVGKTAVLGLGYQMGPDKFQMTLKNGTPSVDLDINKCKQVVSVYRSKNYDIVKLWDKATAILSALVSDERKAGEYKCLKYYDDFIELPNGMHIKYDNIVGMQGDNEQYTNVTYKGKRDVQVNMYGGKCVENLVQALARIIVSDQMLEISKYLDVVTMTHDEVVALAPADAGQEAVDLMVSIMSTPPEWCADLPLGAEGGFDVCYSK